MKAKQQSRNALSAHIGNRNQFFIICSEDPLRTLGTHAKGRQNGACAEKEGRPPLVRPAVTEPCNRRCWGGGGGAARMIQCRRFINGGPSAQQMSNGSIPSKAAVPKVLLGHDFRAIIKSTDCPYIRALTFEPLCQTPPPSVRGPRPSPLLPRKSFLHLPWGGVFQKGQWPELVSIAPCPVTTNGFEWSQHRKGGLELRGQTGLPPPPPLTHTQYTYNIWCRNGGLVLCFMRQILRPTNPCPASCLSSLQSRCNH